MKCESRAAEKTRAFYIHVFLPWAAEHHVPSDPRLWFIAGRADCKENLVLDGVDKQSRYWTNYEWEYDQLMVESFVKKGETQKAIAATAKVLERATTNEQKARVYVNIGHAYGEKGEYDKEIEDDNEALRLDVRNADAYAVRGRAYGAKGDYDKMIADETEAVHIDPTCAKVFTLRGWAYGSKGEHDKEIADYTEAIRLDPKYAEGYSLRADAYKTKFDRKNAIADFSELIRLTPQDANAHLSRGDCYMEMLKFDKAIADYNEMIRLMPGLAEAFAKRGNALLQKGKEGDMFPRGPKDEKDRAEYMNKAIADLTEAIRLDPKDIGSICNRAVAYETMGDYNKAIADENRVLHVDPGCARGYFLRGQTYEFFKSLCGKEFGANPKRIPNSRIARESANIYT